MERATMMETFHGTLKSPSLRDASFSSYLQPHHHHTIGTNRCRGGLDDSTSELSIFDAHKYFNEVTSNDNNIQKATTTISSSSSSNRVSPLINNTNNIVIEGIIPEIITETTRRYSSASSSVDGYNSNMRNYRRTSSFHAAAAAATPTASSEASWNSQAGLLSHPPGSIPVSMMSSNPSNPNDLSKKHRASLSKPIWFLRKKCPCSGKKSVEVKEKKTQMPPPPPKPETLKNVIPITPNNWVVTTTKSQRFHSHSHKVVTSSSLRDGFTFPVLNPPKNPQEIHEFLAVSTAATATNNNNTKQLNIQNGVVEDPARDSLEVFQPPCNNDTIELPQVSPKSSRINIMMDDDAHSDASSDLFEIESFSATTAATQSTCATCHPVIYRRGDSMDEASSTNNGFFFCRRSMDERSTATTECYEPSEASIEWSVTTAAAEDESCGGGAVQGHGEKWKRNKGSSSLVSCRSEKAVSVGPQPVRAGEGHRGATCSSRHVSVSSSIRAGVSSVNKPPLGRSHNTACMSLAFAT